MSQRFIKFGYLAAFIMGLLSWYLAVINVIDPVVHPLFGRQYNTLIFAVIDTTISYWSFWIWLKFDEYLEDDYFF